MSVSGKKLVLALIGVVALLYVISPIELVPGPVDDAVVILCGMSTQLRN